jgi:hypothetical protein
VTEPKKLPHLPLAQQVVRELKIKLEDMLQREDWERETPLDYNEVHILYTAVHLYLIDLKFSCQYDLLGPCISLCRKLSFIVEQVDQVRHTKP